MLAPPLEGSFDIEDANLPIKSTLKDGTPEQLPLLTQEEAASTNLNASEKGMVRQISMLRSVSICQGNN
jgi:hypothetical protein